MGWGIVGGVALGAATSLDGYFMIGDRGGAIFSTPIQNILKDVAQPLEIFTRRDQDFTPDSGRIDHPVAMTKGQAFFLYILDEDGEVFVTN